MLVTTTPTIEGGRITRYYGIVSGETIIGANVFRDFLPVFVMWWADVVVLMKKYCAKRKILPCVRCRNMPEHSEPMR